MEERDHIQKHLKNFFKLYHNIRKNVQIANVLINKASACDFSIFKYFDYKEEDISRIIGDLLQPCGSHGQGSIFLKLFIDELIKIKELTTPDCNKFLQSNLDETWVQLEAPTYEDRRIDILLINSDWVLAIENKPWDRDRVKQLEDYDKFIEEKYKHITCRYLLYISGHNSPPNTISTGGSTTPLLMTYRRRNEDNVFEIFINDWLEKAIASCKVDKLRHFLADFLNWVLHFCPKHKKWRSMMTQSTTEFLFEELKKEPKDLEIFLSLYNGYNSFFRKIVDDFYREVLRQNLSEAITAYNQELSGSSMVLQDSPTNSVLDRGKADYDAFLRVSDPKLWPTGWWVDIGSKKSKQSKPAPNNVFVQIYVDAKEESHELKRFKELYQSLLAKAREKFSNQKFNNPDERCIWFYYDEESPFSDWNSEEAVVKMAEDLLANNDGRRSKSVDSSFSGRYIEDILKMATVVSEVLREQFQAHPAKAYF